MKTCPQCGSGFVGFEKLCDVCRRAPVAQGKERRPPKAEVVGSTPAGRAKKSVKDRVYQWREKHPERYRKYMRELMRKRNKGAQ